MQSYKPTRPPPSRLRPATIILAVGAGLSATFLTGHLLRPSQATVPAANLASRAVTSVDAGDTQYVFELPRRRARPAGVVVLLHGCGRSALDFWERGAGCATCAALPEETGIVASVVRRGYVAVAVSSSDRRGGCWRVAPGGVGGDFEKVRLALRAVRSALVGRDGRAEGERAMGRLIGFGISSGGRFATALPFAGNGVGRGFTGVVAQISRMDGNVLSGNLSRYPPVAFIHMPRDEGIARGVGADRLALRKFGVASTEFKVERSAFTVEFCRARLPKVGRLCEELVSNFRREKVVGDDFYLVSNPRRQAWRKAAEDVGAAVGDPLVADKSGIAEVLNVAYAVHEGTSHFADSALDWLEAHSTTKSASDPVEE